MTGNVACFSPGCRNPVIGQCPGYNGPCGHFYCAKHTAEKLCSECGSRKKVDEETERIYQDYLRTAQGLFVVGCGTWFVIGVASLLIGGLLNSMFPAFGRERSTTELYLILAVAFTPGYIAAYLSHRAVARAKEIAQTKPYFDQFFKEYRKQKGRQALGTLVKVAGAAALIGLGAAAAANRAQVYSDIHDIKNRLDRM